jgi:hypothetical protein
MKWISIAALMALFVLLWGAAADAKTIVAAVLVWAGAITGFIEALRAGKYVWGSIFVAVGILFNPILPIMFPRQIFLTVDLICLAVFAFSLALVKTKRTLSLASVTNPSPRSDSL